jgi:hypothetical protein
VVSVLDMLRNNRPFKTILDGYHEKILKSAEELRDLILKWYDDRFTQEIPSFGSYIENGRPWTRGDILAMEMVTRDKDLPEDPDKKLEAMQQYLRRQKYAWGSTPEYTAFSFMSNCCVVVYQAQSESYQEINRVEPQGYTDTIRLLYSGKNHYDVLVDDAQAELLMHHNVNGSRQNILDLD